ncbi:helix-turn-helix transcriptional regulator [Anaerobranca gottschalkii]|uniref:Predicted DNA-binding transcriptional regulator YafY, contains an HTH and WYL domains n=1 Tax=Anaerobranca gottschalkii DSM 13577 TaxID=1120990 RepID=A0A1I0AAV4_9FIRM|nr:WYL domain-containing protein [Anaerobranca gottschalkii]SES90812.1 Predicted DNA-binding transcriptional regulator YafY, contains an HTH and WYL domains [Anaerobranca gottschalkii DSM 13577]
MSIIKFLGTGRECSVDDVIDGIEHDNLIFDKMTYYRKLEYLLELGIVEARKEKNVKLYKLQSDFFKDFSEQELKDLYYLTLFFSHVEKPSVPGIFLKENIKRYLKDKIGTSSFKEPFLYRFLQFHQVLEEEIVWNLLEAIQGNRMVKIYYQSKKSGIKVYKNLPVKIILDVKYGRWYLIAYNLKQKTFYTYPLHRVEEVEVLNAAIDITKQEIEEKYQNFFCNSWLVAGNKNGTKEVKIKFTLDPEITENFLLKMVKRDIINPKIEILNPKEFILTVYVSDIMEIKPWIKGFSYRAEVLPSKEHSLREEIKGEWEEVLSLYENI